MLPVRTQQYPLRTNRTNAAALHLNPGSGRVEFEFAFYRDLLPARLARTRTLFGSRKFETVATLRERLSSLEKRLADAISSLEAADFTGSRARTWYSGCLANTSY